jgi:hypothetical protein
MSKLALTYWGWQRSLRRGGGAELRGARRERGRLRGERHVDQARDRLARERLEPQLRLVDVLHAVAVDEIALPRIRPAVIRAHDRAHVTGVGAAQERAAVAAHVVKRADRARVVAHHQHRGAADGEGEVIARIRNLDREPGEQPPRVPHALDLGVVQRGRAVEGARHAVAVAAGGEQRFEVGGKGGHGGS